MKIELVVITLVLLQLSDGKRHTHKMRHKHKRPPSSCFGQSEFQRCIRNRNVIRYVENDVCELCEDNVCLENPCKNGGTCFSAADTQLCQCPPSYQGLLCELDNVCLENPCKNGGTCFSDEGTQLCQCPPSYQGQFCELECTVEFGLVVKTYDLHGFVINEDTQLNSTEECSSTCTGNCTASLFQLSKCQLFSAPVLSVTDGNQNGVVCEEICEQQSTCWSYIIDRSFLANCYTFTTSSEGLPPHPSSNFKVFFDKALRCKPTL